jgi:hypothetical protein
MQQKLVLYIGNVSVYTEDERVDQFKDESVSFTQTIQNVKDLKKIFTEFTKTFALPASKKNNKIFDHYYNYDIVNGFDARVKVNASLELNDIPFKKGKIALTGVDLKNNVPHTYKITFYGNTVNLKDILGDDQLSNLTELSILDTDYNYSTVLAAMQNEYLGNLIVPLITHTDRATYDSASNVPDDGNLYYRAGFANNGLKFTQFKYALRLQAIISAIELQYPDITFSDDFFNDTSNTDFYNLYMWLHRKKGEIAAEEQVERVYNTFTDWYESFGNNPRNSIIQDGYLRLQLNYPQEIPNGNTYFQEVILTLTPTLLTSNVPYSVKVFNLANGSEEVGGFVEQTGTQIINFGDDLNNMGLYAVQIACASTIEFAANGGIEWYVKSIAIIYNTFPNPIQTITSIYIYKNVSAFTTNLDIEFNILEQIPKMKIIDFLTGVFQMFNLTAYVEDDIIVVQPLDEFYDKAPTLQGQVIPINIDEYLDVTKSAVDIALPFSKVNFTYKGVKTFLAQQFNQLNNKVWGSSSYSLGGNVYDTPSTEYKIEIPFEHVMYERLVNQNNGSNTDIQYGYFVDDNQESYIGEPLIFYKYRIASGTNITIRDLAGNRTVINNYHIPMNSKDIDSSTSKVNIHFDNYVNEYLANSATDSVAFTDTLFQTQYSNYINEVFNPARRLTKVTAYLPYKIFSSLQLYDRIEIGQKYYKINSMTTNLTTGKTEFELLNTDL